MTDQSITLQSNRQRLEMSRIHHEPIPSPSDGEVLVRVDIFALTTNNITYGVAGDMIGYWQFFPAEDDWGCIPVWGYGEVIQSRSSDVPVGKRLWGYFPMSTHVVLKPAAVSQRGFSDGAQHRSKLPPIYNRYEFTDADPAYSSGLEGESAIYKPLFVTSFLIDAFLEQNDFFGAQNIIISSASSKTGLGSAMLLSQRPKPRPTVIGLTSESHIEFTKGLGCYDLVLSYAQVGELPLEPSVYVDIAGAKTVRAAVHEHLNAYLKHSSSIGATHWEDASFDSKPLAGPPPQMFFAPSVYEQCAADWGTQVLTEKLGFAVLGLIRDARQHVQVESIEGAEALQELYDAFITGEAEPAKGYVVRL